MSLQSPTHTADSQSQADLSCQSWCFSRFDGFQWVVWNLKAWTGVSLIRTQWRQKTVCGKIFFQFWSYQRETTNVGATLVVKWCDVIVLLNLFVSQVRWCTWMKPLFSTTFVSDTAKTRFMWVDGMISLLIFVIFHLLHANVCLDMQEMLALVLKTTLRGVLTRWPKQRRQTFVSLKFYLMMRFHPKIIYHLRHRIDAKCIG